MTKSASDYMPTYDADAASQALNGLSLRVNGTTLLAGGGRQNAYVQSALQEGGSEGKIREPKQPAVGVGSVPLPSTTGT